MLTSGSLTSLTAQRNFIRISMNFRLIAALTTLLLAGCLTATENGDRVFRDGEKQGRVTSDNPLYREREAPELTGHDRDLRTIDEDRLLQEVSEFVVYVHDLIESGDYERWRKFLTSEYIEHYSDTDLLSDLSERAVLRRLNQQLRTLEDYFHNVVRASRTDVAVEEIDIYDESRALALAEVDGREAVLFHLRNEGDHWKIDRF